MAWCWVSCAWGKLWPGKRGRTYLVMGLVYLAKWSVNEDMFSDPGHST